MFYSIQRGTCAILQVNLCQKLIFLHQLTHNMTTDCLWNYRFSSWKLQVQNMRRTCSCPCFALVIFMSWTGNSMNNLLSYCGLVDARIIASEKDLPVLDEFNCSRDFWSQHFLKDFKNSPIDTMKLYHRSWSVKAKLLQESSLFNEPISFPGFLRGLRWGFPNSKLVPRSPKEAPRKEIGSC